MSEQIPGSKRMAARYSYLVVGWNVMIRLRGCE